MSSCHCEWAKWREGEAWKEKGRVEQVEGGTVSSCHCEWAKWREGEAWKEKGWVEQVEGGRGSKKRRGRVTGRSG